MESPRIFQCLVSIPAGHWVRHIDGVLPRRRPILCDQAKAGKKQKKIQNQTEDWHEPVSFFIDNAQTFPQPKPVAKLQQTL